LCLARNLNFVQLNQIICKMKRAIITAFLLTGISVAYAQEMTTQTLNYSALEKKLKKSDEAIVDEKDKLKADTWFNRGELLQDIHDVNIELIRLGMTESEAKLFLKEPNEVKTSEVDGKVVKEDVYDRITLIYENGVLKDWKETQVIHPDPLPEALKAYREALKLDEKGKLEKKVKENLDRMKVQAESDAIRYFTRQNYAGALKNFELIQDISKTDVYHGYIDSVIIYNSALAARNAEDHKKAAEYFEKAASIHYGGSDTYYLLKTEYIALKDSAKALDALERGYAQYPDSTLIIFELVNYNLSAGNSEEGMKYLQVAENLAGDNPSIYFAKGTLFEKLGDKEKAMAAYRQALEVDPEFFNAWFNIGALYFNNAVEMYEKANAIEDLKEYNKAKAAADDVLKKAIEPLEKAHQINPKDKSCLETLSTIYYRLQMLDKRKEVMAALEKLKAEEQ
jgi:tetratricopeptide (TPR) repeat protein